MNIQTPWPLMTSQHSLMEAISQIGGASGVIAIGGSGPFHFVKKYILYIFYAGKYNVIYSQLSQPILLVSLTC